MTQYRLLARAQMHGEVREPGYIFTLADGELGPHKTVNAADPGINLADHMNDGMAIKDVPLYEEIPEDGLHDSIVVVGDNGYPQPVAEVEARREADEASIVKEEPAAERHVYSNPDAETQERLASEQDRAPRETGVQDPLLPAAAPHDEVSQAGTGVVEMPSQESSALPKPDEEKHDDKSIAE